MKKLFILFLMAICCTGYAQAIIDPLLSEEMGRRNDDDQIKVIVIMKSQYDRAQLNRRADYFVTRAERREFVVNELKEFATASQYDLRHSLSEMERNGMVSSPTILWMANALSFDATKAAINDLARRNDIEIIGYAIERCWIPENEVARQASATREITQNVLQVNADDVWALGYTGQGVVVAVVDTGVNYNHVDLADHLWDGGEAFPHHGYDVYNGDNDPMDDHGHGSHCSGTVLGDGTAGSQTGMAPDATLMCVKCINANGSGGADMISAGMQWAVEHGCDVFSMSLGVANSSIAERTLLRNTCVASLDAGIAGAIAAGNEGDSQWQYPIPNNVRVPGSCPPPYMDEVQGENPGDLSCSICIGAVDYNDNAAYFTSHGPVTWTNTEFGDYPYQPEIGLIRPDVCAPGVDIKSLNYQGNTGYTYMSGTSMATPCVAGCIALMLSKDINLMPSDICRILEETAVPLAEGKSNIYGFGRVDVFQAVEAIQLGAIQYNYIYNINSSDDNPGLNPGESVTMSVALVNTSEEPVSNASIVLTTTDENVTITQNTATCPAFAPNQSLMVEDAFAFSVSDDVVAKQNIRFNLEVYVDGEQTGTFGIVVTVYDSRLEYGAIAVLNDDNGNGLLDPGETADLRILVDNTGNQLAEMVMGNLSTDYGLITLNDTEKSFGTIGADLMAYADFNVTLDASAPEDFVVPFTLDLVDFNGRHTELTFNYKNSCNIIFSLHDSYGDGWQGNYLTVEYSDGTPTENMTVNSGSSATYIRELASGSTITLTWHNGQWTQECSFEITYEDGTVIYQNAGGFSGTQTFTINCAGGGGAPEFCEPVHNLTYTTEGNLVHLTWEAPESPGCFAFEVYRGTQQLVMSPATALDDYVEEGVYNYCVYACYMDCQSEYVCTEVEVSLCSAVQNLRCALYNNHHMSLFWDAPEYTSGLVEYQVYMDDEFLGATNELTFQDTITKGEHDVFVRAVFEGCEKDVHISVCFIGTVANLAYTNEGHLVTVTWDPLEGASAYEVYYPFNEEPVAIVEEPQYVAEFESGYSMVQIRPVFEGCYVYTLSLPICICDPAEDLSFVAMDETGLLHFVWSNVSEVEYYDVVYNGNTTQVTPENGGATGFSFDAIMGENTLCVTAHSVYGCDSEPVCLTQMVCPAVDGFDYSFNGSEVTVTWNGDANSYMVRIDSSDNTVVETNAYTTTLGDGEHQIEVTPVYEDCLVLAAGYGFALTNIAPEIRITDVHEGYITMDWTEVGGALAYNLYRDGELMAENLAETSNKDTEMAIDMQHCYAVQSVFEKGVSDLSEAACANYFNGLSENDGKVAIFPNPTSDKVTIQCASMTLIEVYSSEGKLVKRIKVEGDAYQLDGLESGVYTLRIHRGEEVLIGRMVRW